MDNLHLRNEIARRRDVDPDLLRYWFKYGLCLLALGMLYHHRQSAARADETSRVENGDHTQVEISQTIAAASQGLAVTLIPAIGLLGKGRNGP